MHIRKNKRMVDRLKRCNLVNACMSKNSNLFDEIKRQRKCNQTSFATSIDGHNRDIPNYLASKYEKVYNSVEDDGSLFEIEEKLDSKIAQTTKIPGRDKAKPRSKMRRLNF